MKPDETLAIITQLLRESHPGTTPWTHEQWQCIAPALHWHRINVRLATRMQHLLSGDAREELMRHCHAQMQRSKANVRSLCRIAECLDARKLRYLSLKGPALSQQLYGNALLKQSCDIDILVAPDDVHAVIDALQQAGITPQHALPAARSTWNTVRLLCKDWLLHDQHNHVKVELHWRVEQNPFLLQTQFDDWFARKQTVQIEHRAINVMAMDDIFIHILVHGARSLWTRLHWLADFDALLRRDDINWTQVARDIDAMQLSRVLHFSLAVSDLIFASPVPPPLQALCATLSPRQRRRSKHLTEKSIAAMQDHRHYTSMDYRLGQLALSSRFTFRLYELATLIGPNNSDAVRLTLPIYFLPAYLLLRPWFVIERRLESHT